MLNNFIEQNIVHNRWSFSAGNDNLVDFFVVMCFACVLVAFPHTFDAIHTKMQEIHWRSNGLRLLFLHYSILVRMKTAGGIPVATLWLWVQPFLPKTSVCFCFACLGFGKNLFYIHTFCLWSEKSLSRAHNCFMLIVGIKGT